MTATLGARILQINGLHLRPLVKWLNALPAERLDGEATMIEVALAAPKTRALEALMFITEHFVGGSGLSIDVRVEMIRRLTTRVLTPGRLAKILGELAPLDEDAKRVAVEAYRLPAQDLSQVHTVLIGAIRTAPPGVLVGPFHRGEPIPKLGLEDYAAVAVCITDAIRHVASSRDKPLHTAPHDATQLALSAAKAAVMLRVREGQDGIRRFVALLDDELRRLDIVHALRLRKIQPTTAIQQAVWRGGPDGKRTSCSSPPATCWLALLNEPGGEHPHYGLLSKVGARYVWKEGTREEVFALLPDACFEAAIRGEVRVVSA